MLKNVYAYKRHAYKKKNMSLDWKINKFPVKLRLFSKYCFLAIFLVQRDKIKKESDQDFLKLAHAKILQREENTLSGYRLILMSTRTQ